MNEKLRDIYVEAYTYPAAVEIIHWRTVAELQAAFGAYLPEFTAADFYETEIGTAGLRRVYMARQCDPYFTLERKVRCFLEMRLSVLHVPPEEQERIVTYVTCMDLRAAAKKVMDTLFASLSMRFDLNPNGKWII